jgi:hypothetical protein
MDNSKVSDNWFYSDPNWFFRFLTIFIKGDAIIIIPFLILTIFFLFFLRKLGLIILLVFVSLRFLGEMIYWLLQQFSKKDYRPYDFGFKNLSNNSIYIIYQLFSLCMSVTGISLLIYILNR